MKRKTSIKKLKTIEDLADSSQCPCFICSSQDIKKEGDNDFEISNISEEEFEEEIKGWN